MEPAIGAEVGDYRLEEILGRGAMAVTWRATHRSGGHSVALKIPNARFRRDPTFVVRFLQEAHLDARLDSRYVVRIEEVGEDAGLPYMAMELLHGLTLAETLASAGPLPVRRALDICRDVAEALGHAHARGVVHRDLKPANIMLRVGKCLKVMDFGIAKITGEVGMTGSNVFLGSPAYAAPENVDARRIDHRADLYSLGIILFEMVQGVVPFSDRSPVATLLQHRDRPLPAHHQLERAIPLAVYHLIEALAAKAPEDRIRDARACRVALEVVRRSL